MVWLYSVIVYDQLGCENEKELHRKSDNTKTFRPKNFLLEKICAFIIFGLVDETKFNTIYF